MNKSKPLAVVNEDDELDIKSPEQAPLKASVTPPPISAQVEPKQAEQQVPPKKAAAQVPPKKAAEQVPPKKAAAQVPPKKAAAQVQPKNLSKQVNIDQKLENKFDDLDEIKSESGIPPVLKRSIAWDKALADMENKSEKVLHLVPNIMDSQTAAERLLKYYNLFKNNESKETAAIYEAESVAWYIFYSRLSYLNIKRDVEFTKVWISHKKHPQWHESYLNCRNMRFKADDGRYWKIRNIIKSFLYELEFSKPVICEVQMKELIADLITTVVYGYSIIIDKRNDTLAVFKHLSQVAGLLVISFFNDNEIIEICDSYFIKGKIILFENDKRIKVPLDQRIRILLGCIAAALWCEMKVARYCKYASSLNCFNIENSKPVEQTDISYHYDHAWDFKTCQFCNQFGDLSRTKFITKFGQKFPKIVSPHFFNRNSLSLAALPGTTKLFSNIDKNILCNSITRLKYLKRELKIVEWTNNVTKQALLLKKQAENEEKK